MHSDEDPVKAIRNNNYVKHDSGIKEKSYQSTHYSHTWCGNKETGLLLLLISGHVDDEEEGDPWTSLYRHTKVHSRASVSLAVTIVRSGSCV